MRGIVVVALAGVGLASGLASGGGFPSRPPSGREVIWPPPGGLYQIQPPDYGYHAPQRDYHMMEGPPRRYLPSYRYRGQYVPPPGPDWPDADYSRQDQTRSEPKPKPLQPGQPVEVVPPPGIPVNAVKQKLSRRPSRNWRPVKGVPALPVEPPVGQGKYPPSRRSGTVQKKQQVQESEAPAK